MPRELHLHPDRLHAHGASASGLSEELWAALRGAPLDDGPLPDERERLLRAVAAAVCELAELSAALAGVAAAATAADAEVRAALARFRQPLDRDRA